MQDMTDIVRFLPWLPSHDDKAQSIVRDMAASGIVKVMGIPLEWHWAMERHDYADAAKWLRRSRFPRAHAYASRLERLVPAVASMPEWTPPAPPFAKRELAACIGR